MKIPVHQLIKGDVILVNRDPRKVEEIITYKGGMVGINYFRNGKMTSKTYMAEQIVKVTS